MEGDEEIKDDPRVRILFLSTPSGWRATSYLRSCLPRILFLSTPSGWRATQGSAARPARQGDFYPRPPGGGRHQNRFLAGAPLPISIHALRVEGDCALSPSGAVCAKISIHALRVEGDCQLGLFPTFKIAISIHALRVEGDNMSEAELLGHVVFLSTPSGWRATSVHRTRDPVDAISIHALRVEGDTLEDAYWWLLTDFYPRPPGGGRLQCHADYIAHRAISIHALRVEGDLVACRLSPCRRGISIHALRVEGDYGVCYIPFDTKNFYPRPPGGGRRNQRRETRKARSISIHALRVEGDLLFAVMLAPYLISIHALRVEGD